MKLLEKLYLDLDREDRLILPDMRTPAFFIFNSNIARSLVLPTLKYGTDSDDDWAYLDKRFLHQLAIIQIITSLESYYENIFITIGKKLKLSDISANLLGAFIKKYRLLNEFTNALEKKGTINVYVSELIPKYFSLQEKEKIKSAITLIGLNPIGSFKEEWEHIFGRSKKSVSYLRHGFVHKGIFYNAENKIDENFIKERIKDAILLVGNLEEQISKKYPKEVINQKH